MRSILFSAGMFVLGSVVGCADLLGIEPWNESAGQDSSSSTSGSSAGGAGGTEDPGGAGGSGIDPCRNGVQDGTETGVDCGGDACGRCEVGSGCITDSDCASTFCPASRGYCISADGRAQCGIASVENPTCGDCIQNIDETDVDCGGVCSPCRAGKTCGNDTDCWSGLCVGGVCASGTANTRCYANGDCAADFQCADATGDCKFDTCCTSKATVANLRRDFGSTPADR